MISIVGYNFCSDGNALDPMPTNINNLRPKVSNGLFEHFNVTRDVTGAISDTIPSDWDLDTIINAAYEGGDIAGGNIGQIAKDITAVRIKRRPVGTFDWIVIHEIPITDVSQLSFVINDNLALSDVEYEYAFVPMIQDVEGQYIIQSIKAQFNGVFIADNESIFRLNADVQFGDTQSNQRVGVYAPYGRQYPVVISNGITNYQTGSVSATIMPDDYDPTMPIDKRAVAVKRQLYVNFLNNRKTKLLKKWQNGEAWLVYITDNPSTSYLNGSAGTLMNVSASWTEVGDANSKQDLYESGMIPSED